MKAIAVQAACITALGFAGCAQHHEEEHAEESTFVVTSPLRADTDLTREYVAQVRAIRHIEIRAMEEGYLQDIFVDEGQLISEGQKMFQIMPLILQAEVSKAGAETELATIEYENTKSLADKGIVSATEVSLAKAKLAKATAQQQLAETHRGLALLKAPFSGLMDRFHVRKGSLVEQGELLTTLSDNSTLWIYFNVTEKEYLDYMTRPASERPKTVKFIMANNQVFDQVGKIETIEADFDNETGNIAFRATFPNPHGLLRHGQTGKILMELPVKNALLVPQKATFEILDRRFVFAIDQEGLVRSQPISVSAELPDVYVISDGLKDNDRFVLEGLRKVRDGRKIKTEYQEPKKVLAGLQVPAE